MLETVYEPEVIAEQLATRESQSKFAQYQAAKVFNTFSDSEKISFQISPEPTRYDQVLEDVCPEHREWKEAMDEEMRSMERFAVYQRVPKSAAGKRQVLGCKWVYRRKRNRLGEVIRYRARLVAQGFRQKAYDSFDPDGTYSPVVHKDTLRLFLAVSAALNLKLYQCDVKSAFLQAALSEPIFMQAPPGYATRTSAGEPEVWLLQKAVYGLKQASHEWWEALRQHLTSKGYVSLLGDPCLLKRVLPNGKIILCAIYVDDLVLSVSDQDSVDLFMRELSERFVVEEGEAKPVDFLLGMAVDQDLVQGTVSVNMEAYIKRLAEGILTKEELERSKSVDTPMLVTPLPKQSTRTVTVEAFDYLSVVGS
jgi:hypothetical protein